jgi:hypothetical protein
VHHSFHAHYIEVPIEHESGRVTRADSRDDVRTARHCVGDLNVETPILESGRESACDFTLARCIWDEGGIP